MAAYPWKITFVAAAFAACGGPGNSLQLDAQGSSDGKSGGKDGSGSGSSDASIDAPPDAPPDAYVAQLCNGGAYAGPTNGNRCSESNWCPVEPAVPATLRSMSGCGANDVWAAGEAGTLLHWDGTRLTRVAAQTHDEIHGIWSAASDDVWALANGAVLHFNGSTWTRIAVSSLGYPWAISGASASSIWTVGYGGVINHYDGNSWNSVPSPTAEYLYAVYAGSPVDAWAAGSNNTLIHWDGGSWQSWPGPSTDSSTTYVGLWGSSVADVWLTNGGTAWHWDGSSWTQGAGSLSYRGYIKPIWGKSANDAWSPGEGYNLDHWDGSSWTQVPHGLNGNGYIYAGLSGYSASASDVWFTTVYGGLAHGNGSSFDWKTAPSKMQNRNAIWASSATNAWVVGDGPARHYDGSTWSDVTLPPASTLHAVFGVSPTNIYAAGDSGTILHYDGSVWTKISGIPTQTWSLYAVWASGPSDVYAIGYLGNLSHYNGSTWTSMWSGATTNHVYGLYGFGATDIWGATENGKVIHKTANGWSATSLSTYDLYTVWGLASNDVWAAGQFGHTYHWNGSTWAETPTPATMDYADIKAIRGRTSNDIWAVGGYGELYHWDGSTWSRAQSGSSSTIHGLAYAGTTLFGVGDYGTIVRGP